eukprot:137913-Chlamydomonas_euryale.AAC.4
MGAAWEPHGRVSHAHACRRGRAHKGKAEQRGERERGWVWIQKGIGRRNGGGGWVREQEREYVRRGRQERDARDKFAVGMGERTGEDRQENPLRKGNQAQDRRGAGEGGRGLPFAPT